MEELFEDLSYEMAPVPCAGQDFFRNVIKRNFGEVFAGLTLPAAVITVEVTLLEVPVSPGGPTLA